MVYIYILKQEQEKYYIGKTNNPNLRLKQHFNTEGSKWTEKYKPIKIDQIIDNCDDFDEDKYTLIYMKNYGIENVRGGSFCELILSDSDIETIKKMIKGSTNKCYLCGKDDHFMNNCTKKYNSLYKKFNKLDYYKQLNSNNKNYIKYDPINDNHCIFCNTLNKNCYYELYGQYYKNIVYENNDNIDIIKVEETNIHNISLIVEDDKVKYRNIVLWDINKREKDMPLGIPLNGGMVHTCYNCCKNNNTISRHPIINFNDEFYFDIFHIDKTS